MFNDYIAGKVTYERKRLLIVPDQGSSHIARSSFFGATNKSKQSVMFPRFKFEMHSNY